MPYPAGGNVDSAARIIADKLQEKLGQPFIIENKAGAGGMIAGEAFAKSAPDGYTLFVGANGPVLFATEINKRDAYNWKKDFLPITTISMTSLVLEVHPSVQATTFKEFIDLAKREPGKLTMASPGPGTTNHLLSELMQSSLDLQWVTAHYRGNAPAVNDLFGRAGAVRVRPAHGQPAAHQGRSVPGAGRHQPAPPEVAARRADLRRAWLQGF